MKNRFYLYILFPALMILLELGSHFCMFGFTNGSYILSLTVIGISLGALISLIGSIFKKGFQKAVLAIILLVLAFLFGVVMIYYSIFQSFFMWKTIGLAGDVTAFWREALIGMKNGWYMILLAIAPFLLYVLVFRRYSYKANWKNRLVLLLLFVLGTGYTVFTVYKSDIRLFRNFQNSPANFYYQYGITASTDVDIYQVVTKYRPSGGSDTIVDPTLLGKTDVMMTETKVIRKNIIEMDEAALLAASPNSTIKDISTYFLSRPASNQNDYTGLFEGKNLIFLTLEGFSYKALSPEITPTLWKLYHEGFHFTQFYDPLWGGSTATGEYANITGDFYYSASCLPDSASTLTYSAMGRQFKNAGYDTYSYHNGSYYYYDRNLSHPNFGYDVYKAVYAGLELERYSWPNSDYLMAKATVDDYINSDKPFHAYYMTISGHTYYTFSGNSMASKHRDQVSHLPYSSDVQAYIATEIEVEDMVTYLIERLEAAGKLDDTVIAMCCDHYPYGLPDEACVELYDLPSDDTRGNFELYKNAFILWCNSMEEPVVVDKPCCAIDVLPTLLNLFGLEYDSRFIMGTDILSDNESLCIINTSTYRGGMWNWKTAQGTYHTYDDSFEKSDTCTLTDEQIDYYVRSNNQILQDMRTYSYTLIEENYYSYVFNKDGTPRYPARD